MTVTVWLDLWRETVVVRRRFGHGPTGSADPADHRMATERYLAHCRWLHEARAHPVVQVVHTDDRSQILSTGFVGAASAASTGISPAEAAQLLSSVTRAFARLHACGLTHGNLSAEHILIRESRFWLCSPSTRPTAPSADVAALGGLVTELMANWERAPIAPKLNRQTEQRWQDLAAMAADPSMSAARLAARADRLG